jgi:ankyrin repeat protein
MIKRIYIFATLLACIMPLLQATQRPPIRQGNGWRDFWCCGNIAAVDQGIGVAELAQSRLPGVSPTASDPASGVVSPTAISVCSAGTDPVTAVQSACAASPHPFFSNPRQHTVTTAADIPTEPAAATPGAVDELPSNAAVLLHSATGLRDNGGLGSCSSLSSQDSVREISGPASLDDCRGVKEKAGQAVWEAVQASDDAGIESVFTALGGITCNIEKKAAINADIDYEHEGSIIRITPFEYCILKNKIHPARLLLHTGLVDLNRCIKKVRHSLFHEVAQNGSIPMMQLLLRYAPQPVPGQTWLHELPDTDGNTPLMSILLDRTRPEMALLLCRNIRNVFVVNTAGLELVGLIMANGNVATIKTLFAHFENIINGTATESDILARFKVAGPVYSCLAACGDIVDEKYAELQARKEALKELCFGVLKNIIIISADSFKAINPLFGVLLHYRNGMGACLADFMKWATTLPESYDTADQIVQSKLYWCYKLKRGFDKQNGGDSKPLDRLPEIERDDSDFARYIFKKYTALERLAAAALALGLDCH